MSDTDVATLRRQARRAERRMRVARVIATLPLVLVWASVAASLLLTAKKLSPSWVSDRATWGALGVVAVSTVGAGLVAWARRLAPQAGALALDRYHDLSGRLTNAVAFDEIPRGTRSPWMDAAIDDARAAIRAGLRPREAVPLHAPRELLLSAACLGLLGAVALAEVRTWVQRPPSVAAVSAEALELGADDLELFRDALKQLAHEDQSAELRQAVETFNRLIEDLADKRLSRDEAFRRMKELEEQLSRGAEEDRDALRKALADMAKELSQSELSKPAGEALEKHELKKAREALSKLAEKLGGTKKPDKKQLEKLKKALDRAAQANKHTLERLEEKRAELKSSLLKAKEAAQSQPNEPRAKSLLKKKERELERLERDIERRDAAARKLSRLERQLGKAAADLLRDLGVSADELRSLTEDLNRLEQEELSDQEKDELRKRIQELRELIRQQGQGGDKLKQRLKRFMRQARGAKPNQGKGGGKKAGAKPGGSDGDEGDDGDLRPGQGPGEGLQLGQGGKAMPVEVPGGSGAPSGQSSGAEGEEPGGSNAGHGSAAKLGKATDIAGRTLDVEASGLDSGRGKTNSEVILGAADRGFTGKAYRRVFKQYQTVAEDQVEKEKIPDGMRFYVRRYFQLIRPRE